MSQLWNLTRHRFDVVADITTLNVSLLLTSANVVTLHFLCCDIVFSILSHDVDVATFNNRCYDIDIVFWCLQSVLRHSSSVVAMLKLML